MHAKRLRALVSSIVLASCALGIGVNSIAAATCALAAPASAGIGAALSIEGSGFPANTGVDVSITIGGGAADEFTAQSDAAGAFKVDLTPEASEAGNWTVRATAGADCSAQVVIAVGTPASTPEPSSDGQAAGTGGAAGAGAPPPTTDAASDLVGATGGGNPIWLGLLLLALGIGGRIVSKPVRSR